jgi:hypothetical protein
VPDTTTLAPLTNHLEAEHRAGKQGRLADFLPLLGSSSWTNCAICAEANRRNHEAIIKAWTVVLQNL